MLLHVDNNVKILRRVPAILRMICKIDFWHLLNLNKKEKRSVHNFEKSSKKMCNVRFKFCNPFCVMRLEQSSFAPARTAKNHSIISATSAPKEKVHYGRR